MLNAVKAKELSVQGAKAEKRRKSNEKREVRNAWIKAEREKNPERIREAEQFVKNATNRGERQVETWIIFAEGRDYHKKFDERRLCKPHRELIAHFRRAGYSVDFDYDWEPLSMTASSETHTLILKW